MVVSSQKNREHLQRSLQIPRNAAKAGVGGKEPIAKQKNNRKRKRKKLLGGSDTKEKNEAISEKLISAGRGVKTKNRSGEGRSKGTDIHAGKL